MAAQKSFYRVAECLYRNGNSGTFYALLKRRGKQIKRSLGTKELAVARRKLRDFQNEVQLVDPLLGKVTVATLVDRYLYTIQHQAIGTTKKKRAIGALITKKWGSL